MKTKISIIVICLGFILGMTDAARAAELGDACGLSKDGATCATNLICTDSGQKADPSHANNYFYCAAANTTTDATSSPFNYTPLENIPGFESEMTGDFYTYISLVYKFGIWAVGIAALLMITIGGFMYVTSAGNNSSMEKAKGVITDAIIGLILALTSYLLLYIINPDLVKITPLEPVAPSGQTGTVGSGVGAPGGGAPSGGTKKCSPVITSYCSINTLQNSCFGSNAETMSKVCGVESGGNPSKPVKGDVPTDKCKDGKPFSIGLFQINMITSAESIGCNGNEIFTIYTSDPKKEPQGSCLERKTNSNGTSYCATRNCEVKPTAQKKYDDCAAKLRDPNINMEVACELSGNGSRLSPSWTTTKDVCGL